MLRLHGGLIHTRTTNRRFFRCVFYFYLFDEFHDFNFYLGLFNFGLNGFLISRLRLYLLHFRIDFRYVSVDNGEYGFDRGKFFYELLFDGLYDGIGNYFCNLELVLTSFKAKREKRLRVF